MRCAAAASAAIALSGISAPAAPATDTRIAPLSALRAAVPGLDPHVLGLALKARDCAIRQRLVSDSTRLAIIDYSRPSTEVRLWVLDLARPSLIFSEHVAHGRGSGDQFAKRFSNEIGSHTSSLGLFRTAESYDGRNGYSLRMDGLEPGFNDRARDRAIVMHGAWYADPVFAERHGRLGRSQGCPAVRPGVAKPLIDAIGRDQLLFAYYPDTRWLNASRMLHCGRGPEKDAPRPR